MIFAAKAARKTANRKPATDAQAEGIARLVVGADGAVLYASPAFWSLAGTPSADKMPDLFSLIRFENADDAFRNPLGTTMLEGLRGGLHAVSFPQTGRRKDFQFDWVGVPDGRRFLIASAQENDRAFADSVLALVDDKSQGREADDLQNFLALSRDAMAVARADGTFIRTNETLSRLLGYSEEDLRKKNFLDLVHPDDRPAVRPSLQALMRSEDHSEEEIIDFECRMSAADGRTLWMSWKHRRTAGRIYSVGSDVTAIKRHELALHRREQQLVEAEAIGQMGHWRWLLGDDNIQCSDEIYRIFGVTRDNFRPTVESLNAMLHRRDVGRMAQAFQRAMIEQNDYDMDFRIIRPTGEIRHIRCQGRCEQDAQGGVVALYGIMHDVTELMLHERDLREAKESAERAYAAKSQFLANMSHELRTPLNAIIGFSEMMQRQLLGPIGTERYLDYINGIRQSGEHLLDLISDILDMSKIEAGKYELDLEDINIAKTIRLAVHMMEGRALDASIKLGIDIPNENLQVVADRRALMQILLNLLSNAVKFSEDNGSVRVEVIERADYLSIKVHDKGIGIPANKLKTITNPFEQAASHYTREHEGTGLGLAITKELTELHGGSLHIDSTVGVGTTVTVRLPYDASKTRRDIGPDETEALKAVNE